MGDDDVDDDDDDDDARGRLLRRIKDARDGRRQSSPTPPRLFIFLSGSIFFLLLFSFFWLSETMAQHFFRNHSLGLDTILYKICWTAFCVMMTTMTWIDMIR